MKTMEMMLQESAESHNHLCPRQVIGVRMGLLAATFLETELPQNKKRLLTIIETDGCFADGIEVSTGCSVGHRTLRIEDYGKVAAVFVDTKLLTSFRIAPKMDIRILADEYGDGRSKWERQLKGYQIIPDDEMFTVSSVKLRVPVSEIVSRAGIRTNCNYCEEEIINEREVIFGNIILCQTCAGVGYYELNKISKERNIDIFHANTIQPVDMSLPK